MWILQSNYTVEGLRLVWHCRKATTHHQDVKGVVPISVRDSTHDRLMLQAALAVAFFGFLRVSKFTVNSWKRKAMRKGRFLAKQDVLLAPYNLQLTIKYSKMDQLGKGSIIAMRLTRSSLLSSPRHAILLKVLSCQASCSIIPLPVWQTAVSPKATVHPPFSVAPEQL